MKRLTAGVAAVLLAFVVTGCSESTGGSSTGSSDTNTSEAAGGANEEAVAWADELCTSIQDDVAKLTTEPELDQSSPQAIKDSLVTYLDSMGTTFDSIATKFEDAGTPPVADGEEAVTAFTDQLTTAKDAVASAKTKIEAAPVDDPAGFQAAVTSVGEELSKLGDVDTSTSFDDYPEFKAAYDAAESCQALEGGSSSGGSETPTS